LPPLKHRDRLTNLDVHHTILPPLGKVRLDPSKLFDAARPIDGTRFFVLAPEDMVLHSAAHLFQDGELAGGIRDLSDMDLLLRHFGERVPLFWDRILARAEELGLRRPFSYALRFTRRLLNTPLPDTALLAADRWKPALPLSWTMDLLIDRALLPPSVDSHRWDMELSNWLLLMRGHWLRMPLAILLPHLGHQVARRWRITPTNAR
jgi:hypothetical protein